MVSIDFVDDSKNPSPFWERVAAGQVRENN
jgi:hypothetical protein